MGEVKHTPGPWQDADGTTTGRIVTAPGEPKVRRNVAACGGPNRDANARLIAAAPDLLAACDEAEAALHNLGYRHIDAAVKARAAIVKARSPRHD